MGVRILGFAVFEFVPRAEGGDGPEERQAGGVDEELGEPAGIGFEDGAAKEGEQDARAIGAEPVLADQDEEGGGAAAHDGVIGAEMAGGEPSEGEDGGEAVRVQAGFVDIADERRDQGGDVAGEARFDPGGEQDDKAEGEGGDGQGIGAAGREVGATIAGEAHAEHEQELPGEWVEEPAMAGGGGQVPAEQAGADIEGEAAEQEGARVAEQDEQRGDAGHDGDIERQDVEIGRLVGEEHEVD